MNNEISNKPCGCGNCEPMCTTCGRPWVVCKGECGCNKPCCNKVNFCEYGRAVPGCIRERAPECPMQAVIPSVVVESISNLKNLADCFVHVTDINTTFYIDDKHRAMITWAGPVEYNNYDLEANTLGLRSQLLIDEANNLLAYYDKTGNYQLVNSGGDDEDILRFTVNFSTEPSDWSVEGNGAILSIDDRDAVVSFYDEGGATTFTNQKTAETITAGALYDILSGGQKVILDNVPLGMTFLSSGSPSMLFENVVNGVLVSNASVYNNGSSTITTYSGNAAVNIYIATVEREYAANLGIFIGRNGANGTILIQGFYINNGLN